MFNPLDKRGKNIRTGDECRYKGSIFTIVDIVGDNLVIGLPDSNKKSYHLKADQVKRVYRPLHVEAI